MTRDPAQLRKLYPLADVQALKVGFKEVRSLKCSITGPVEFVALHAQDVGSGTVKFGCKQVRVMSANGAPKLEETVVTMRVARENFTSRWLIDHLRHERKEP